MDNKSKQQELQEIMFEVENYKRRMEGLSRQSQAINDMVIELNSTIEALEGLSESKSGTSILVPIGSNSFIRAELKDTENIIFGIGANISVEKTTADAKKILEARGEELKVSMEKIQNAAVDVNKRLLELNAESEKLIREIQEGQK
jgi:prefoldin alpha subunit